MIYKLKIKEIRKEKGMTQKDLAEKIGISDNYLSNLENNKFEIKLGTLIKISTVLNVDIKELYEKIE